MSKYLRGGMKLVYLDQCAVSELYRAPTSGPWGEIRALLSRGVKDRRLMCPRSMEHLFETSSMSDEQAVALDRELDRLSFSRSFLPEVELVAMQLVRAARNAPVTLNDFLRKNAMRSIDSDGVLPSLRERKAQFDEFTALISQPVNEIRAIVRDSPGPGTTKEIKEAIIGIIRDRYKTKLEERLTSLGRGFMPDADIRTVGSITFPDLASSVCLLAIAQYGFTKDEAEAALLLLSRDNLEMLPTVMVRAELEAICALLHIKFEPADHFDIIRIASALPYADIMVVDGGRHSQISDLKLDWRLRTTVFSTRPAEQERLIAWLRAHVGGVAVGGPRCATQS